MSAEDDHRVPPVGRGATAAADDLPVVDLREVVETGLARGGHLLTAGEHAVLRRIRELEGPAARLYARLTARVPVVFALDALSAPGVPDPVASAEALVHEGLADRVVPWSLRAEASTVAELQEGCRRLGLPTRGRRADLVARLRTERGWSERPWLRILHRPLVRRLERWALLRVHADRSSLVVERLGLVRWPVYGCTSGGALHADRRDLLRWEALVEHLAAPSAEVCLAALRDLPRAPGGLDLGGRLRAVVFEAARERERTGDFDGARALYEGLLAVSGLDGELAVRLARTLERAGDAGSAVGLLRRAHADLGPAERIAVAKAGRRTARQLGTGWAPEPPLRKVPTRRLALAPGEADGPRPRWRVDGRDRLVEDAVAAVLSGHGRRVVRGEGGLWTTLYALLLEPAYFLPVPGALPVRRLSGPLDVGTPAFRGRRWQVVDAVMDAIARGEAPDRVRAADARRRGEALAGAAWSLADGETLAAVAGSLDRALSVVLERLLDEGWDAARGLPDLVVLPGPEARVSGAWPTRVGEGPLLVEVKGPGDTVRDEQAVWFDRLLAAGVRVELWNVVPA